MPKGWTLFGTNALEFGNTETRQERVRREARFANAIRNTPVNKMTEEEAKEHSEKLFEAKQMSNAQLLQAFKEKKLKSKKLIKKAKALKKEQEKKQKENTATAAQAMAVAT